jgi:hypothetical protein
MLANSLQHYVELVSTRHSKCYLSKQLAAVKAKLSRNFHSCKHKMVPYGYLPAPQRQSRDAANPSTTQPDKLVERVLRFVIFFVQLTNTLNGKSAYTKTRSRKCAHVQTQRTTASCTVYTVASSFSSFTSRKAVHLTTKLQILDFHTHTHTHKINSNDVLATLYTARQTAAKCTQPHTCTFLTTHYTNPHNCPIANSPFDYAEPKPPLSSAVRWLRSFRHNILHVARKQEPIQFCTFMVGESLNVGY